MQEPHKTREWRTPISKPAFRMVQVLRGIAAGMVLMHHAAQTWMSKARGVPFNSEWNNLASGVDIFFVISGFVMAISATGDRTPSAGKFMARRVLRIVPMYWLMTLLTMAKIALSRTAASSMFSFDYVLSSLLFVPWRPPMGHYALSPILAVGWTLYYEMFFYLLLACALLAKIAPLRLLTPLMLLLPMVGLFHQESWPAITLYFSPLLLEFLAGFYLAHAWRRGIRISPKFCTFLFLLGFVCLFAVGHFGDSYRALLWGVPAFLIVSSFVFLEASLGKRLPTVALNIGNASYSLYLIHPLIIAFLMALLVHIHHVPSRETSFVLLSVAASTLAALGVYRFVEQPLTRALGTWTRLGAPRLMAGGSVS